MSDVTPILQQIEGGDPSAAEKLLPLVYDELRKLAAARMADQRPDHTLQATALVHEAYVRPVDVQQVQSWDSRGHFYAAASEAMRRILVEHARQKRIRQGGEFERAPLAVADQFTLPLPVVDLLALHEALERFEAEDPQAGQIVKLRFFAGLSMPEIAQLIGHPQRPGHSRKSLPCARRALRSNILVIHLTRAATSKG
jgi:RNA polymerase sigma factor (TIGR02999 family)